MSGSDAVAKTAARQRARLEQLLAAAQVHLADADPFTLLGGAQTWAELRPLFEQMLAPYQQRDAVLAQARAQAGAYLMTIRGNLAANGRWLAAFAEAVRARYGRTHPVLKDFGLTKGARKKPSVRKLAAAVAARAATRQQPGRPRKRRG
jgi:hypothetical protein